MRVLSEYNPASYQSRFRAAIVGALLVGGALAVPASQQLHAGPIIDLGFSKYQGIHNSSAKYVQFPTLSDY
jgi:hypothetical protein